MDNDDCDLFSIVHSCKATTFTSPTTIFETLPPPRTSTTPSYFDNFSLTLENRSTCFPPLKPTDFIELDKLKINFNSTTSNLPIIFEPQQIQPNLNNQWSILKPAACIEITTAHFDLAYNHPSISQQCPILKPQTNSKILENTNPQGEICRTRKRKFDNQMISECHGTESSGTKNPVQQLYGFQTLHQKGPKALDQRTLSNNITGSKPFTKKNRSTCFPPLKPTDFTDLDKLKINFNSTTSNLPIIFEPQQIQPNLNNQWSILKPAPCIEITTAHFDLAKFDNQMISECHVSVEKLGQDPWEWSKYGQKPIKKSPHP
ncbi:hypothetical protein RYX36_012533, partial [Vicia faba]